MVRRDSPSPQEALDQLHLDPVRYQHLMAFMQCIAAADRYIRDYAGALVNLRGNSLPG
jgi:hypothetical protein